MIQKRLTVLEGHLQTTSFDSNNSDKGEQSIILLTDEETDPKEAKQHAQVQTGECSTS